jgi:hypothetical protein
LNFNPFGRRHGKPGAKEDKRGGRAVLLIQRGGDVHYPPLSLPDCPPAEREASAAAFDELCRQRPLKPPSVRA